ncbi:serine hydrolase domain-containing protein [Salegentibacter mishustinae]|uniref:Serine hydrolase n=1 Tax=Salegentibacter mishustinae TaxID=270918 RepID=A0A0Q9ZMN2_9FLAO|nr:serine hydrolase domain-containing protein [Salegentibacter mishustinae]KRG30574.1 serine hydrolase [Salegentibacter mishustinae]PNW23463.1 serine hydrolase [Salegentibacter mishustinae]PZX66537.1 CubicO group peptidase (beta-lactamase class C family) [Salegentibacter mishustinae]GGW83098.1 penicillin-binding protein [Salegentibacter mishustinae]
MRNFILFLFSITIIITNNLYSQNNKKLDSEIASFLDTLKPETFSGIILVGKNDSILEERTYGYSNIENKIKIDKSTKFHIASITKSFTAVGILKLYEQGKVDLNKPIGNYIENYPNQRVLDSVTIHQLLTHTAGTKAIYGEDYQKSNKDRYRELEDYLPLFANDSLNFQPGSKYEYNGGGFVLLGLIIQNVTGENYYDYLQKSIFDPIGMDQTKALEIDGVNYNTADGYSIYLREDKSLAKNDYLISKASGASGYYSTAEDLFKFSKTLRNYGLLNKGTTELMLKPKVKCYNTHLGYGIDIDKRYEETIIGHSGGWYGIRCEWMDFSDSNYTVIILSNFDNNGQQEVSDFFKTKISRKLEVK